MTNKLKIFATILTTTTLFYACSTARHYPGEAYIPVDKPLYDTVRALDSTLFDAFNSKDFERFEKFFSNDLEIYQDNVGVRDYNQSMEAFRELLNRDYVLTRQLVEGSLEVYPIKGYGAIETGKHTFCHTENGKPDCGTFKFTHIWERRNGEWKITRIITYDH